MNDTTAVRQATLDTNGHLVSPGNKPITLTVFTKNGEDYTYTHVSSCGYCDTYVTDDLMFTEDTVKIVTPCPIPNGITTVTTLDVPSGMIIVTDDLRIAYGWYSYDQDFASYNSVLGQHQAIEHMASKGCAFGPVGNSCPSLYRTGKDTYIIATPGYTEDVDGDIGGADDEIPPAEGAVKLAGICTDLWAYSIADFADWTAKSSAWVASGMDDEDRAKREKLIRWREENSDIVDVTPGTYEFTHHTGEKGFTDEGYGPIAYASIKLVEKESDR